MKRFDLLTPVTILAASLVGLALAGGPAKQAPPSSDAPASVGSLNTVLEAAINAIENPQSILDWEPSDQCHNEPQAGPWLPDGACHTNRLIGIINMVQCCNGTHGDSWEAAVCVQDGIVPWLNAIQFCPAAEE